MGSCGIAWVLVVRVALLPSMVADDFPDPWGFSDCEDGSI